MATKAYEAPEDHGQDEYTDADLWEIDDDDEDWFLQAVNGNEPVEDESDGNA